MCNFPQNMVEISTIFINILTVVFPPYIDHKRTNVIFQALPHRQHPASVCVSVCTPTRAHACVCVGILGRGQWWEQT